LGITYSYGRSRLCRTPQFRWASWDGLEMDLPISYRHIHLAQNFTCRWGLESDAPPPGWWILSYITLDSNPLGTNGTVSIEILRRSLCCSDSSRPLRDFALNRSSVLDSAICVAIRSAEYVQKLKERTRSRRWGNVGPNGR